MRPAHQERTAGGKRVYDCSLEEGAGGVWGTQGYREKLLEGQEAEGGEGVVSAGRCGQGRGAGVGLASSLGLWGIKTAPESGGAWPWSD